MKKLSVILGILFISVLVASISLNHVLSQQDSLYSLAISRARDEVGFESVSKVQTYNGTEQYVWITAKKENGIEQFIFVPTSKKSATKRCYTVLKKTGISEKKARDRFLEEIDPKEIRSITLGVEDDTVVWEIIYMSKSNKLGFYYIEFQSGDFFKRYLI